MKILEEIMGLKSEAGNKYVECDRCKRRFYLGVPLNAYADVAHWEVSSGGEAYCPLCVSNRIHEAALFGIQCSRPPALPARERKWFTFELRTALLISILAPDEYEAKRRFDREVFDFEVKVIVPDNASEKANPDVFRVSFEPELDCLNSSSLTFLGGAPEHLSTQGGV